MEMIQSDNNGENTSIGSGNTVFPEGMRVLAVDDNTVCLKLLKVLLNKCRYQVTDLSNKTEALELLKQNADSFDIVLTNVYIDEMEGFKLLEAGQELNIPVIMISASESRDIILKGVRYGAVDYLIKPIRLEVVKTIWQHVYRKKLACSTPLVNEVNISLINNDHLEEVQECQNRTGVVNDHSEEVRDGLNRTGENLVSDRVEEIESDVGTSKGSRKSCKKDRMSWTPELKDKFNVVVELLGGPEKAVPKKILELMDEPGVTREQVASHLQKVRKNIKEKPNRKQSLNQNDHNDDLRQYQTPLGSTSVAGSSSHQPILGNTMSPDELFRPNYQRSMNYNTWQRTPSFGYTTPMFQDKPNESILRQPKMMSDGGNLMGSSSSKPNELILRQPTMMSDGGSFMGVMGASSSKPNELVLRQPTMMLSNDGNFMGSSSSKPPIESIWQQPSMMSNDGNIMGSSSRYMPEQLHIPIDPGLQLPEVVVDQGPSMNDFTCEFPQWNNIFNDIPPEFPTSFDFPDDDKNDFGNC